MTASRLLVLLAILCVSFLILDFTFWKDTSKVIVDPHDCKHHCEWQLAKMNETFNILIKVCEEKLQKLHNSDLNMAIIREQLQKEFLELFLYELQTFSQRLHDSTKIDPAPQYCLEYCTAMDTARHRECKENVTNNNYHIQMLLQRERWLRSHVHKIILLQLSYRGDVNSFESETLSTGILWPSIIIVIVALLVGLHVMVVKPTRSRIVALTEEKERTKAQFHMTQTQLLRIQEETRSRVAAMTEEKERIEAQFHTTQTQLLQIQEETRSRVAAMTEEKERIEAQFHTTQTQLLQIQAEVSEKTSALGTRNSILESWNEELLRCEMMLKSRLVEKDEEYKETLALKDKSLKNMDKFWHQWLVKEKKARRTAEEKETASVEELKQHQSTINELKAKLKQAKERDAEGEQIMIQRQEELERKVRELDRETKFLQLDLEECKMHLSLETERKNRALAHVSKLEKENNALRLQAARLVEGALKKGSKASKLGSSASHHQTRSAQESKSLQVIDSRLEDIRQDVKSRFTQLQNEVTRDSEELRMLRLEHQKLCENLELANRRNIQLERRLAYQDPIQSACHKNGNKKASRMRRWISPRQRVPRRRSSSIERNDSFLTQPEYEPVSVQDLTDNSYYLSVC